MKNQSKTLRTMAFFGLLSLSMQSHAYQTFSCPNGYAPKWPSKSVTLYNYADTSLGTWVPDWTNSIKAAATIFNRNPAGVYISIGSTTSTPSLNNGTSEIYWTSASVTNGAADTNSWYTYNLSTCTMTEADIRFKFAAGIPWTTSLIASNLSAYGGSSRPAIPTMLHEMGHSVGLGHEGAYYNIMGDDQTHLHKNGTLIQPYLGESTVNGLVYLYGAAAYSSNNSYNDVSLAHWERTGQTGDGGSGYYSTHTRLPLRSYSYVTNSWSIPAKAAPSNGLSYLEPFYKVTKGQWVTVYFQYENNGKDSTTSTPINYYLSLDSPNDEITTQDTFLLTQNVSLTRSTPDLLSTMIQIPTNTTSGFYRLGAIIDPLNNINEMDETDNASYVGIQVL